MFNNVIRERSCKRCKSFPPADKPVPFYGSHCRVENFVRFCVFLRADVNVNIRNINPSVPKILSNIYRLLNFFKKPFVFTLLWILWVYFPSVDNAVGSVPVPVSSPVVHCDNRSENSVWPSRLRVGCHDNVNILVGFYIVFYIF